MANGNGERGAVEEVVVSEIRAGMKREFRMMIKAQGECGLDFGARRVTRSQNELSRTKSAAKNVFSGCRSKRRFNGKKRMEEVRFDVLEEIKDDDASLFDRLGVNSGDGDYEEKVGFVSEEEEMKSDVLDSISDDDANRMAEVAEGVRGQELADGDVVTNVDAMGPNAGNDVVTEGPMDGLLERVNEHVSDVGNERGMSSTCVEISNAIETSDADFKGRDAMVELENDIIVVEESEASDTLTPVRHYTRRSKVEALEESGIEDVKVSVDNEDSAPLRRFTRSLLDTSSDALKQSAVEALEQSGIEDDVKVAVDIDDSASVRRFTRSLLDTSSNASKQSAVEALDQSGAEDDVKVIVDIDDSAPVRRFTRSFFKTSSNALQRSGVEEDKGEVQFDARSPLSSSVKMELKMSKKVELKKNPGRLKELLESGFLEGLPVFYVKGSKARVSTEAGLRGEICGSGILCFCKGCKGRKVVTPTHFELHAGSGNKRPSEYIHLENGKPLRDILNLCNTVPSDLLEQAIQVAVGHVNAEASVRCLRCNGSIQQYGTYGRMLCDSCIASRDSQVVSPVPSKTRAQNCLPHISGDPQPLATKLNYTPERPLPSVPSAKTLKVSSTSHSRSKGHRKVTKKDLRLHKLVFESDLLPDRTELAYYANGKKMREGYKSGQGIYCHCCHQVVSPSVFESHAGFAGRRKPYLHIYTSNGVSLHELSIEIKKALNISTDESDDVCSICEGMGELLCCDNCPRAFHTECINLPNIPQDKWYCRYCEDMFQREKFVAFNINAVAAGRIAGVDPFEEIKKRCIRIVETLEANESECVLCRGSDFSRSGFGPRTVILCDQCEREYHIGCLKEHEVDDLEDLPPEWFCSIECGAMYSSLQQLVHDGEKTLPNSMLSIIREKHESVVAENSIDLNLTWRVLCGKVAGEEDRKWLSGAVSVFHDRFDPIGYSKSSRSDLIPTMIYGRSNQEQDFGGMYCAVLILDSKVVSAGIFRILGRKLAEIPLVATSSEYQGKGYFQSLLGCVEELLASLKVEEMVLPAAPEAESIWKNKFGFKNLSNEQLIKYRKEYPVMLFQGTTMLHKSVPKLETSTDTTDV